jgi:alpha-galactosidase
MIRWIVLSFLLTSSFVQAADLTGKWVAETTTPNGDKRTMTFFFKPDGAKLTGAMTTQWGDEPFQDGAINGDTFSFVMVNGDRRTQYQGRLEGDQLHVTIPGFGQRPAREVIAKKVSDDPKFTPPAPLPPVSLPEVRDLPDNKLARTPPMGWNSWNFFARRIDDAAVRGMADAMASNGMKAAGYTYINIDDTWEGTRDAEGNIRTNEKFPDMKALADYVHSKGLKIGIYSSPGPKTCAGFEGSYAHEEQDAKTWAAWGIDYLKYDWCSATRAFKPEQERVVYQKMAEALRATGRPIVYSLCQYGAVHVEQWGAQAGGNLWRTTGDIRDQWESMSKIGFDQQQGLAKYAGPGHWNDPDMLEIGNGKMTDAEYRTHMSLWAMLAAPLLAGNDIRTMSDETKAILLNADVIAVDQDKLGAEGTRISKEGTLEIWVKPMADGGKTIAIFNRGDEPVFRSFDLTQYGASKSSKMRDLWSHTDAGKASTPYSVQIASHAVVMLREKR